MRPRKNHPISCPAQEVVFDDAPEGPKTVAHPDLLALGVRDRRDRGAQQEGIEQADLEKARAFDAALERVEVDGDVGKLGQAKPGSGNPVGTDPDDMIFE